MKAEQARTLADQALAQLAQALAAGRSEELTRYLSMLARFHRYSVGNVFLILAQKPDATHVAGYTTWKQMGRYVRKGEKGIVIIAPMVIRRRDDEQQEREGGAARIVRFRGVHVFDVSQTDGQPLPEPTRVSGDPSAHIHRLRSFIHRLGIALDHDTPPAGALGVSRGGRITIRCGLSTAEEFAVTVHELAHEMLHRGEDRPKSRTVRETEAEAVAFVVCRSIGLETGTASSDYIQLYDGDVETLSGSLERIQRVAAEIITAINAERDHAEAA